ncbi:uncharacterized protein YALI1_D20505g [Yarrowia lipolytica]|uniref:Uncharacterized protein n=1 Tax=Yarrowia lipolytica TaxID=4952 RepID=A0A1D8NEX0_YARLL|nr:hypothetical protein YALI1_D20505g [Yarrowia lipolytica]
MGNSSIVNQCPIPASSAGCGLPGESISCSKTSTSCLVTGTSYLYGSNALPITLQLNDSWLFTFVPIPGPLAPELLAELNLIHVCLRPYQKELRSLRGFKTVGMLLERSWRSIGRSWRVDRAPFESPGPVSIWGMRYQS